MCWVGQKTDKKIAQEDIRCKKVLLGAPKEIYYAYFHEYFEYEFGKLYKAEIKPQIANYDDTNLGNWEVCNINEGLHCYSWNIKVERLCGGALSITDIRGREATYPPRIFKPVLVECTIPKGAEYWENDSGVIVSNRLIIEEEIYEKYYGEIE